MVETWLEGDKRYVVKRVVQPSGHYTFRVSLSNSRNAQACDELLAKVDQLGCLYEWYSETLLGIDTATEALSRTVANYLYEKEQQGYWEYETGRTR